MNEEGVLQRNPDLFGVPQNQKNWKPLQYAKLESIVLKVTNHE